MKKLCICLLLVLLLAGCRDLPDEQSAVTKTTEPATTASKEVDFPKESIELKPIGDLSVIDDPAPVTPPTEVESVNATESVNR